MRPSGEKTRRRTKREENASRKDIKAIVIQEPSDGGVCNDDNLTHRHHDDRDDDDDDDDEGLQSVFHRWKLFPLRRQRNI